MNSDHEHYCVVPGDLCKYTLNCVCCHRSITAPGRIGETLYHASVAMLRHWEMIDYKHHRMNPPGDFKITLVPLLFSRMDSFQRAKASFEITLIDRGNIKGVKEGKLKFGEAVQVDVPNQKNRIIVQVFPAPWH